MRIATWNVERLKHRKSFDIIMLAIEQAKADILVLTETDEELHPQYKYCFSTPKLSEAPSSYFLPAVYKPSENRVSIFTNYPCVKQYNTYDKFTSLCVELSTPKGNLLVYGTIIGILGNRHPSFKEELNRQCRDFKRLSTEGKLCICGDFNCSFADNYYFTKADRAWLLHSIGENKISLLTRYQPECIDHIAVSKDFMDGYDVRFFEWNTDKSLSDHKGIVVDIYKPKDSVAKAAQAEYESIIAWKISEFEKIKYKLLTNDKPFKFDVYIPEIDILNHKFEEKICELQQRYDIGYRELLWKKAHERAQQEFLELTDWVATETIKVSEKLKSEGRLPYSKNDPNMREYDPAENAYKQAIWEIKIKYHIYGWMGVEI